MKARLLLTALAATVFASASACSGGPGTPAPTPSGSPEPPGSIYEPPGSATEPGTTGSEPTGSGQESPGGATTGNVPVGACPACNTTYDCVTPSGDGGSPITISIKLVNANGVCTIEGDQGSVFSCGGTISLPATSSTPASTVSWQSDGQGGFTTSTITCDPAVAKTG